MKDKRYTVVENAGYVGERDITSYPTAREAWAHIESHYDADERDQFHPDCLHPEVRLDYTDDDGNPVETYDFG